MAGGDRECSCRSGTGAECVRKEWKNKMSGLEQMDRRAQTFRGGHIDSSWRRDDMRSQENDGHVHGLANDDARDDRENASCDSLHDLYAATL